MALMHKDHPFARWAAQCGQSFWHRLGPNSYAPLSRPEAEALRWLQQLKEEDLPEPEDEELLKPLVAVTIEEIRETVWARS